MTDRPRRKRTAIGQKIIDKRTPHEEMLCKEIFNLKQLAGAAEAEIEVLRAYKHSVLVAHSTKETIEKLERWKQRAEAAETEIEKLISDNAALLESFHEEFDGATKVLARLIAAEAVVEAVRSEWKRVNAVDWQTPKGLMPRDVYDVISPIMDVVSKYDYMRAQSAPRPDDLANAVHAAKGKP